MHSVILLSQASVTVLEAYLELPMLQPNLGGNQEELKSRHIKYRTNTRRI